jgi:tripartite-type tricarboxylate transporter receptor subunit TctC
MTCSIPVNRGRPAARCLFAAAIVAGLAAAGTARADTYPSRTVQVLTTFSAGNIVDLQARAVAEEMRKVLGQQVVVVNKEGAAGLIAFGELARAAPDGYTVLFGPQGMITLQPHLRKEMPFDVAKIDPICQLSENKFAVFVAEASPLKSFGELVAAARKNPGKLNHGNAGIGTIPHVQWFIVEQAIGIQTVPVPYRNFATMPAELMSGQIDFAVTTVGSAGTQQLRPLAMLDSRRAAKYPNVPSVKELG